MIENKKTIDFAFSLLRDGKTKEGVELLYKDHYARMYSIAFSVLKNEHDSRDVVHNVIAKLLSMNPASLPNNNEVGWLYTVVKNESIKFAKNNNKASPFSDDVNLSNDFENSEINDLIDIDAYQKMISCLDAERQEVVSLKVLGGFTHKEIAKALGKPIGTIQWLYATSIVKLKKSVLALLITTTISSAAVLSRLLPIKGGDVGSDDIPNMEIPSQTGSIDYLMVLFSILSTLCIVALIYYLFIRGVKVPKKTKNE